MNPTTLEIPVDGSTLAAQVSGAGAPVVLLHAGVGDSRMWDPVVDRLGDRYQLIRYDVRGYGRSPAPTEPFSNLADLVAVLDHFGLDRAHLAGCSMGGATAVNCAIAHPDRVTTLTLLAPGLSGFDWPDDPDEAIAEQALADQDLDAIAEFVLKIWGRGSTDPQTDATVRDQARGSAEAWLTEHLEQREPSAIDHLGEIKQPTIVAVGDRDYPVIGDIVTLLAERIPNIRRVDVPGVDHFFPLRAPDLTSELIAEQVGRAG